MLLHQAKILWRNIISLRLHGNNFHVCNIINIIVTTYFTCHCSLETEFLLFKVSEIQYTNKKFSKNSWHCVSYVFSLHGGASRNNRLTTMPFTDPFLCIIFTNTDCDYIKFARHNLRVQHYYHVLTVNFSIKM